ncbi:MAG: UvrD-helicase domain-containing protein, partial [Hyphomicrobiaceae bacterium]
MTEARSIAPETDIADTRKAQALAADPEASAWVSANAGTGKTYVLVLRVLRLLLAGTAPDRILCLTYTKAAAAEMSGRLFQRLASWATADEPTLKSELEKVLGRPASDEEAEAARPLFARALETPGGLKVQTIHSFCERVLQRFPLEAGIPPNFTILDSESQHALIRRSVLDVLAAASGKDGAGSAPGPLGTALQTISRLAGAE